MALTPDDVRDLLRVLDSSGLDELHLELADLTLTVRREGAAGWTAEQHFVRAPVVEHTAAPVAPAEAAPARAEVADGLVPVHPPLLGTFYRAPQPGAPPFVEVGDEVTEESVVGVVETMKMMTPVHAGVRGTVVEFRTGNGEFAEAGAVLLVVDPSVGMGGGRTQ
jgi:acetyl-CoA carboxylase biotin carboxyl carrier protein